VSKEHIVRPSGVYALYRGKEYDVFSLARTTVNLPCDRSRLEAGEFPDEVERDAGTEPRWVKVPKKALERYVRVHVRATWRGQEVTVARIENE
jgi:hypothetical protein